MAVRIRVTANQLRKDNGLWGNPSVGALNALMRVLLGSAVQHCRDPLTKTAVIEDYLGMAGCCVHKIDREKPLVDRMLPEFYQKLAEQGGTDLEWVLGYLVTTRLMFLSIGGSGWEHW